MILGKEISKSVKCFPKTQAFRVFGPSSVWEKNRCTVLRNIIDIKMIGAGAQDMYNVPIQMKLKLIFIPFGWTVPSWKINRFSCCFRRMLVPLHNATPRTWTSEMLWPNISIPLVIVFLMSRCVVWHYTVVLTFDEVTWDVVDFPTRHRSAERSEYQF